MSGVAATSAVAAGLITAIRTGGAVIIPAITQAIVRLIIHRHNQSGEVFQKDLGPQTPELAKAITSFDPDDTWSPVEWLPVDG